MIEPGMKPARPFHLLFLLAAFNPPALGCPWCRAQVGNGVYGDGFAETIITLLLPLLLLTLAGGAVYFSDRIAIRLKRRAK